MEILYVPGYSASPTITTLLWVLWSRNCGHNHRIGQLKWNLFFLKTWNNTELTVVWLKLFSGQRGTFLSWESIPRGSLMHGTTLTSLHKHSCLSPKRFKHVEVIIQSQALSRLLWIRRYVVLQILSTCCGLKPMRKTRKTLLCTLYDIKFSMKGK